MDKDTEDFLKSLARYNKIVGDGIEVLLLGAAVIAIAILLGLALVP